MGDDILADDLMVANLLVRGHNIAMDQVSRLFMVHMTGHVLGVELLRNLDVSCVMGLGLMVHWSDVGNSFVANDGLVDGLVMHSSLTVDWLDLNVSNLGLVVSVLGDFDVAFMSCLNVAGLIDIVWLLNVTRLVISIVSLRGVLVRGNLWLNVVVSIVLRFSDSLCRNNGGDDEVKSVHSGRDV